MYGYGYRYNSGLVIGAGGGAPFLNTYSLDFDGVDDRLGIGTALSLGTDSTISFWIKRDRVNFDEILLGENTYAYKYTSYITNGNHLKFQIGTIEKAFNGFSISAILNDTTNWINICFVRSGDSVELFLNGVSMETRIGYGTLIDTRFDTIGATPLSAAPFLGNIDEVCAFNRVATPTEIVTLSTAPTVDLTSLNPIAWYRMGDGDTYPTITDNGSGGNNGTMTNMDAGDIVTDVPL
jgi:hypothetical protein